MQSIIFIWIWIFISIGTNAAAKIISEGTYIKYKDNKNDVFCFLSNDNSICDPPNLYENPSDIKSCGSNTITLFCGARGTNLSYQWQISNDNGESFSNLTSDLIYSNVNSSTLLINNLSGLNAKQYRCNVINSCGTQTSLAATLKVLNQPLRNYIPTTVNQGNYCTGIVNFKFNTIDNSHNDNLNDITQDFTCNKNTVVRPGTSYSFSVETFYNISQSCGYNSSEKVAIYIDFNNNGYLMNNELVYNGTISAALHSGTITIPSSGFVADQLLLLRVKSDISSINGGDTNSSYGEIEDYGIIISNCDATTYLEIDSNPKILSNLNEGLFCKKVFCATKYAYEIRSAIDNSYIGIYYGDSTNNLFRLSWISAIKYDSNYKMRVRPLVDGVWQPWGPTRNVITPAPRLILENQELVNLTDEIFVTPVVGATNYRIEITNNQDDFHAISLSGSSSNIFRLSWTDGIEMSTKYQIRVSSFVNGYWRNYGVVRNVYTPIEETKLVDSICTFEIPSMTYPLYCDSIKNATNYRYEIRNAIDNTLVKVSYRNSSSNLFRLSWVSGIQFNTQYKIRVAAFCNEKWGAYGTPCYISTPPFRGFISLQDYDNLDIEKINSIYLTPNPNYGELTIKASAEGHFSLTNEVGQIIRTISISKTHDFEEKLVDLKCGIYYLNGLINNEFISKKIVVLN